jgi:hypothetical protein
VRSEESTQQVNKQYEVFMTLKNSIVYCKNYTYQLSQLATRIRVQIVTRFVHNIGFGRFVF